jgi:DNA-binding response OmpR family regulator
MQKKEKGSKKLLIVEDEQDLLEAMKFDLELSGFEVATAEDGAEGLRIARQIMPDLVILDLLLPKVDGYRVCRMLKVDARTAGIPILMLTAKSTSEDERMGKQSGADLYMTKPFDPEILRENIHMLVGNGKKGE